FGFPLGEEIGPVPGPTVELRVALLAAEALGLGGRNALQAHLLQRLLHLVELEGLDDRLDFFHCVSVSDPTGGGDPGSGRELVSRVHAKPGFLAKAAAYQVVVRARRRASWGSAGRP